MTTTSRPILIILGAGCSVGSGYPIAAKMFEGLAHFGEGLDDDAKRLRALVEKTLALVNQLRTNGESVETLDTLAKLLHDGKAGGDTMQERNHNVTDAKLAVSAYFLSLERVAIQKSIPGYRSLMDRVFGTNSRWYTKAIQDSSYCVLTFNYDRLFELAFRQRFSDFDGTVALYSPAALNSGMRPVTPHQAEIEPDKFCFLKLHGSIDLYGFEEYGRPELIQGIPDPAHPQPITDQEFFVPNEPGYGVHAGKGKPALIVFPNEKQHLEQYPGNLLAFREYLPAIWEAAHNAAHRAEEIQIIGNSCPAPDAEALRSLFAAATKCRRYVIENPHPEDVHERLKRLLPPTFTGEVICKSQRFGAISDKTNCQCDPNKMNHVNP
ncbi:MAG: SIR2 family protein [Limisphaerales bacterium]